MKTKRRLELFAFWQPEEICRHLEDMAQKGWLLLEITHPFWRYRQIPPQEISFDIAYFASASEYDFQLSPAQEEFRDLCAHDGWELACTYGQMMIFYNTRENPTPLETEPGLKLEAIHTYAMNPAGSWRTASAFAAAIPTGGFPAPTHTYFRFDGQSAAVFHVLLCAAGNYLSGAGTTIPSLVYTGKVCCSGGCFPESGKFQRHAPGSGRRIPGAFGLPNIPVFPGRYGPAAVGYCWSVRSWTICLYSLVIHNTRTAEEKKLLSRDDTKRYLAGNCFGTAGPGLGADVGNPADSGCGLRSAAPAGLWCVHRRNSIDYGRSDHSDI